MLAAVRQEMSAGKFPARLATAELRVTQFIPVPTYSVWFDANGLMRELSMSLRMDSISGMTAGDMVMQFSNYGAPVRIAAPASSDTVSYQSFLKGVKVSVSP